MRKTPSRSEQIGEVILIGLLVVSIARLLVVSLLAVFAWITSNLLWSLRVPDELKLSPVWVNSLIVSPYTWFAYLLWGSTASILAWHYRHAALAQRRALWLCWGLLLIQTGWFLQPLEMGAVLLHIRPMYPHGWRVVAEGGVLMMIEPVVNALAIFKMPKWLQCLRQPVHDFLNYGR